MKRPTRTRRPVVTGGAAVECCPQDCAQMRADLARLKEIQNEHRLSEAVYERDDAKRAEMLKGTGFTEVTNEAALNQMGLTTQDLKPTDSNFRAGVFENAQGETVVAFKGTDFTSLEDWKNNIGQDIQGGSDYYTRAQDIAYSMNQSGAQPSFTGHSLGGGLASAAARRIGADASTFNAAGLNPDTLVGRMPGGNIDRVYVKGDIVTGIQVGPVSKAASDKDWALDPPSGIGNWLKRNAAGGAGGLLGGLGGGAAGGLAGPGGALIGSRAGRAAGSKTARGVVLHLNSAIKQSLIDEHDRLENEIAQKCGP
ncbi:MAG: Mbeg1-like protein [Pseudomonadota bacterium]